MKPMFQLTGPSYGPMSGGKPGHLVILLHGYGANGDDLIGLAPAWGPHMKDVRFVSPNAPYPCDGNPFGFQWFGISRLDPELMLAGVRAAAPILESFIDEQLAATGLTEAQTVLVGFSQGTMMALHVGLRRPRAFAGIIGYSGVLAGTEVLAGEIKSKPPVLLVHGDADPVVPVSALHVAAKHLQALEVDVKTQVCPGLAHGIDQTGLQLGAQFLLKAFA